MNTRYKSTKFMSYVWRRHECPCGERFTTFEITETLFNSLKLSRENLKKIKILLKMKL